MTIRDTSGLARGVAFDGRAVLVAGSLPGVVTYDAVNPSAPVVEGVADTRQAVDVVTGPGDVAYVADPSGTGRGGGLGVVTYAAYGNPQSLPTLELPGARRAVDRDGSFVYLASDSAGVQVVDVSTPTSAVLVGGLPMHGESADVTVANGFLFVGAGRDGLCVLRAATRSVP